MSEYADRDGIALGDYYVRHLMAMTREHLNDKGDIASEMAWRDQQIDALREQLAEAQKDAKRYQWLRRKTSAHGVIDGWTFAFPTHLELPASPHAMRNPADDLDAAIDKASTC